MIIHVCLCVCALILESEVKHFLRLSCLSSLLANDKLCACRLLIAEAEKAAKTLEVAATRSPIARASLVETKKLIAEAIQSIESIKTRTTSSIKAGSISSNQNLPQAQHHSRTLLGLTDYVWEERTVNGSAVQLQTPEEGTHKLGYGHPESFNQLSLDDMAEESTEKTVESAGPNGLVSCKEVPDPDGIESTIPSLEEDPPSKPPKILMRKWVRGRLVEVME